MPDSCPGFVESFSIDAYGWAQTVTANLAMRCSCFFTANCARPKEIRNADTKYQKKIFDEWENGGNYLSYGRQRSLNLRLRNAGNGPCLFS
jgi:hypothetical protein